MIYICFAFGPKENYFFNAPSQWARKNLPVSINALFTKNPPIKEVYELVLGENDSYYIGYLDSDGKVYCRKHGLPRGLMEWLGTNEKGFMIRDVRTISIDLGSNGAYWACDKNGSAWGNLPDGLVKSIEIRRNPHGGWKPNRRPSVVALGYNGAYIMTCEGGGGAWDLKGQHAELDTFLRKNSESLSDIAGIWFDAYRPGKYVLLLTNGKVYSDLPEYCQADYKKVADSIPDLRPAPVRTNPRPRARAAISTSQSAGRLLGKALTKCAIIVAENLIKDNSGSSYSQPVYGGSGDGGTIDMSGFWNPIDSAASDPIQ